MEECGDPSTRHNPPPRRDVGRSLQPPVLFEGVQRATHPNKDGMGGQEVGTRTGEVQDSRGEGGAGKGHSHREAASAFGGKHQSLTPSLVKGPSSAGAPLTSQGGQGSFPRKEQHVGNGLCLWFHLGASNLLAQLI